MTKKWEDYAVVVKNLNELNSLLIELASTPVDKFDYNKDRVILNPAFINLKAKINSLIAGINAQLNLINGQLGTKYYLYIHYETYKAEII